MAQGTNAKVYYDNRRGRTYPGILFCRSQADLAFYQDLWVRIQQSHFWFMPKIFNMILKFILEHSVISVIVLPIYPHFKFHYQWLKIGHLSLEIWLGMSEMAWWNGPKEAYWLLPKTNVHQVLVASTISECYVALFPWCWAKLWISLCASYFTLHIGFLHVLVWFVFMQYWRIFRK